MMLTAYSPLARGRVQRDPALAAIARNYGKAPAQVALRWLLDQDGVAAIPKAASRAHLAANLAVFDFTLSGEDRAAIDALHDDYRVVDPPPLDPATEAKLDPNLVMKGVNPAPARGLPVKHPMMHRTRSLDYAVVLSGEIDMMLDDTVVHVKAGDVVVQQATNHGWVNHGTQPCPMLFVLMDSKEP